jgi:hypothetical protein
MDLIHLLLTQQAPLQTVDTDMFQPCVHAGKCWGSRFIEETLPLRGYLRAARQSLGGSQNGEA